MQNHFIKLKTFLLFLLLAVPVHAQHNLNYCPVPDSDYKHFGQSAIDALDIELTHVPFEISEPTLFEVAEVEKSNLDILAASALFLSPVKKLRVASLLGKSVKPVLAGALLLSTSVGLSSCDDLDITEPVAPIDPVAENETVEENDIANQSGTPTPPTFTITYNGTNDPTLPTNTPAIINIEFSSDVVILQQDGSNLSYDEITSDNVDELLGIHHEFSGDWSSVFLSGDYPITVNTVQGKTVITLGLVFPREWFGTWGFSLQGYAKREDIQTGRIHAGNASEYYQNTYKEKDFVVSASCEDDLEISFPMAADEPGMLAAPTLNPEQETEFENSQDPWVCGTKHEADEDVQKILDLFHQNEPTTEALKVAARKANPNKTYIIDIGFILSHEAMYAPFSGGLNGITEWLNQYYIPKVNAIYQNSGVNVEFRAKAVRPFSDFIDQLACPDNFYWNNSKSPWDALSPEDSTDILRELTPMIKRQHGVDFVVGLKGYGAHSKQNGGRTFGKVSDIRNKGWSAWLGSHLASTLTMNVSVPRYNFTETFAHEIGHLLGLWHDEETLSEYPHPDNFTGYGHGYRTTVRSDFNPGTVMSYASDYDYIPLFSSNRTATFSEICRSNVSDLLFCQRSSREGLGFHSLRVGNSLANSSEALQYTIEDASNYSTFYTSASSSVLTPH